jgi:hypothetical protein
VDSSALFSQQAKDLFIELGSRTSETEKGMDVGSLLQSGSRSGRETEIERESRGKSVEKKLGVGVLGIGQSPVEASRNGTSIGDSVDERAGDEFNRGVGGVDGSKELSVDEMVDDAGTELKGAASGEGRSVVGRVGIERKGSNDGKRRRVAR